MREILFRGKEVGTGLWVEGFYSKVSFGIGFSDAIIVFDGGSTKPVKVVSETVGQFTGLLDKNGKKVFEGDLVKILYTDWSSKSDNDHRTLEEYIDDKARLGTVVFEALEYQVLIKECLNSLHCGRYGFIKVIGNVWDNAEMLGVAR